MEKGSRHKQKLKKTLINGNCKSKRNSANNFKEEEVIDNVQRKGTPHPKKAKLSLFASPPDSLNINDGSKASFKCSSPNGAVTRTPRNSVQKKILNRKKTPYHFKSLPTMLKKEGMQLKRNLQDEYDDGNFNLSSPNVSRIEYSHELVMKNSNFIPSLLIVNSSSSDESGDELNITSDSSHACVDNSYLNPDLVRGLTVTENSYSTENNSAYNFNSLPESENEDDIDLDLEDENSLQGNNAVQNPLTDDESEGEDYVLIDFGFENPLQAIEGGNQNSDGIEAEEYVPPNSGNENSTGATETIEKNDILSDDEFEAEKDVPVINRKKTPYHFKSLPTMLKQTGVQLKRSLQDEYDDGNFSLSLSIVSDNPLAVEKSIDEEFLDEEYIPPNLDEDLLQDNTVTKIATRSYECVTLKDALLLIINENTKLHFHGLMSATILQGEVEVLGYILNPLSKDVELYSPRGSSFLYLQTRNDCSFPINNKLLDTFCKLGLEEAAAEGLFEKLSSSATLILCKKIVNPRIRFLQNYMSQQIFPESDTNMPQCKFFTKISDRSVLMIPEEWNEIIDNLKQNTKTFLCGGKSVGKSTMLRYMINRLLTKFPEVFVIDLDPGQPEFTLPGCISGHLVKEPVFGPNFTHLRKPFRCLFVPHIDISYNPKAYLKEIERLMQMLEPYVFKGPILINYMGYTRGLGLDIFAASVALCQPETLIEIHSTSSARNFKVDLNPSLLNEKAKKLIWLTSPFPKFNIFRVKSAADDTVGWCMQPRQIRESCILWYLGGVLPVNVSTLVDPGVPMISVDLSKIHVMYNNKPTNFKNILGQLVALCSLNENEDDSYICHGWGVVRMLKTNKNELYIVTPLELEELEENVRYLVLGSVTLPPTLIMATDVAGVRLPYVAKGALEQMGKISKRSHLSVKAITSSEN